MATGLLPLVGQKHSAVYLLLKNKGLPLDDNEVYILDREDKWFEPFMFTENASLDKSRLQRKLELKLVVRWPRTQHRYRLLLTMKLMPLNTNSKGPTIKLKSTFG